MGASEPVNSHNAEVIDGGKLKSKQIAGVTLLLGLFAPIFLMIYSYGMSSQIMLMSIFWEFSSFPSVYPYSSSYFGFTILPFYALITMFPFVLLRLVPVAQIYRYYQEKTTRRRAFIASLVGDGVFLAYLLIILMIGYGLGLSLGMFPIPLPFQLLFCVIMLWRRPIPEPTTPWDGMKKQQSWWEKDQEPKEEKPKDEDQLW